MSLYVTARLKQGGLFVAGEELECLLIFSNRGLQQNLNQISPPLAQPLQRFPKDDSNLRHGNPDSNSESNSSKASIRPRGYTSSDIPRYNQDTGNSSLNVGNPSNNNLFSQTNRIAPLKTNTMNINLPNEYRALGLVQINGHSVLKSRLIREDLFENMRVEEGNENPEISDTASTHENDTPKTNHPKPEQSFFEPFWFWNNRSSTESDSSGKKAQKGVGGGFAGKLSVSVDKKLLVGSRNNTKLSIFETQTEIIFSELNLPYSQSKSFLVKLQLDRELPPSFDGSSISIQYELVVFIKKQMLDSFSYILHVPFYVISPNLPISPKPSLLNFTISKPQTIKSFDLPREIKPVLPNSNIDIFYKPSAKKSSENTSNSSLEMIRNFVHFKNTASNISELQYINDLSAEVSQCGLIKDLLSMHTLAPEKKSDKNQNLLELYTESSVSPTALLNPYNAGLAEDSTKTKMIKEIISLTRRPSPTSFSLNLNNENVAVVSLKKTRYQLGDSVTGKIQFENHSTKNRGNLPCYQLDIWLESYENINPIYSKSPNDSIKRSTCTKHSEYHTVCRGYSTVGFSLPSAGNLSSYSTGKRGTNKFGVNTRNTTLQKALSFIHNSNHVYPQFENQFISYKWQLRIQVVLLDLKIATPVRNPSSTYNNLQPNSGENLSGLAKNVQALNKSPLASGVSSELVFVSATKYNINKSQLPLASKAPKEQNHQTSEPADCPNNTAKPDFDQSAANTSTLKLLPTAVNNSKLETSIGGSTISSNQPAVSKTSHEVAEGEEVMLAKAQKLEIGESEKKTDSLNANDQITQESTDLGLQATVHGDNKEVENVVNSTLNILPKTKKPSAPNSGKSAQSFGRRSREENKYKPSSFKITPGVRAQTESSNNTSSGDINAKLKNGSTSQSNLKLKLNPDSGSSSSSLLTFELRHNFETKSLEAQIPIMMLPSLGMILSLSSKPQQPENNSGFKKDVFGNIANAYLDNLHLINSTTDPVSSPISTSTTYVDDETFVTSRFDSRTDAIWTGLV